MSLIILLIVVVIVVALLCLAVDQVGQLAAYAGLLKALIIIGGVLVVADKSGLLS